MRNHTRDTTTMTATQTSNLRANEGASQLYEPLDFVTVRAPLLPIETFLALSDQGLFPTEAASATQGAVEFETASLVPRDARIQLALAVGSQSLFEALSRPVVKARRDRERRSTLLRYLIRMSTRPTPFGLFAGVALATWGPQTDIAIANAPPRRRTRPDMAWLFNFVARLAARPEIRKQLRLVTNSAVFFRAGRAFLSERLARTEGDEVSEVSIRATGAVQRVLALARQPMSYQALAAELLTTVSGATEARVESLLENLWEQTFLLTDLRPSLTHPAPAHDVADYLSHIPEARADWLELQAILEAAAAWDNLDEVEAVDGYHRLLAQANRIATCESKTPVQVDMNLPLVGQSVAQAVGEAAARMAELLLRLTPFPAGSPQLIAYRQAFEARYGMGREGPLLELLDPHIGLGPLDLQHPSGAAEEVAQTTRRDQTLLDLAHRAMRDRQSVVTLDEAILSALQTWAPSPDTAPSSLDLNIFVAARSTQEMNHGDFLVVPGPNLGAFSAGQMLGRFADGVGDAAVAALERAAQAEAQRQPDVLWAELTYHPNPLRHANVAIRPRVRPYALPLATPPGSDTESTIPLDQLVVGVGAGRFYLRWPARNQIIRVCSGHMLNPQGGPPVVPFLDAVSRDGQPQLHPFDWGPAREFPFLPRVQVGRLVLNPAQWRVTSLVAKRELPTDTLPAFEQALARWRLAWHAPRYLWLSVYDHRLLLDLEKTEQIEELRQVVRRLREGQHLVLQEVIPGFDQMWLEGPGGHFVSEFVVSLIVAERQPERKKSQNDTDKAAGASESSVDVSVATSASIAPVLQADRLKPPGSDWLFIKLYGGPDMQADIIADPLRTLVAEVMDQGLADQWFFIRYADPDPHIRLRFQGDPKRLAGDLMPSICTWATQLMASGLCLHFSFATYDREVERYGGVAGVEAAETLFQVDSQTTADLSFLMHHKAIDLDPINLAVLSVDNLLAGLGLTETERCAWLRAHVTSRRDVSTTFRERKTLLRSLLGDPEALLNEMGGESVLEVLTASRKVLAPVTERLAELVQDGALSQTPSALYGSYIHMHCNRLLADRQAEQQVLGLLLRTLEGLIHAPFTHHRVPGSATSLT